MTELLVRTFIKDKENRESYGKLGGWVGIFTNFLLFIIKVLSGLFTNSISIMTDAINNLSDSASSLITIVGFKLSSIPSDKEHPYGHARFEYISGLLVSCIVFVIGAQFFINSLKKTIHPEATDFNGLIAGLLLFSILLKLWQSGFYKKIGSKIQSQVLIATSVDSRNDVFTTLVVLISSIVAYFTGWQLDGPIGMVVSLFVIYSGIELLRDTLSPLLGAAPDEGLVENMTEKITSYPSVLGMHDLMVHNYGPGRVFATVHVEIPAHQDLLVSHEVIDQMERDFLSDMDIHLVVHLDPIITDDPDQDLLESLVLSITKEIDPDLSIHDFRKVEEEEGLCLFFDVTVPQHYATQDHELREKYQKKLQEHHAICDTVITIDRNYTSTVN